MVLLVVKLWGMTNVEKYNNNGGTLLCKVMYLQLTLYVGRNCRNFTCFKARYKCRFP